MKRRHEAIIAQLKEVEHQLRLLGFWQSDRPSNEQLASVLPFCHDTLEFPQWLQYVFLEKLSMLLEAGASLPAECGISPYAEEYFKGNGRDTETLLAHLREIDKLLTGM